MEKIIHHIRRVRRQPEDVRRSILHILTIISGVILLSLWVFSLGSGASDSGEQGFKEDIAPLSALKANFIDGYNSISGSSDTQTEKDPELELDSTY